MQSRPARPPAYSISAGSASRAQVPDHSTFSKNRHGRFRDSDLLRQLFETTWCGCMAEGLVGGEGFAVDASLIGADANRQRSVPGKDWDKNREPETASRAVREYLDDARRCRLRCGERGDAEVRVALRSGSTVDGGNARAGLLRLCRPTI